MWLSTDADYLDSDQSAVRLSGPVGTEAKVSLYLSEAIPGTATDSITLTTLALYVWEVSTCKRPGGHRLGPRIPRHSRRGSLLEHHSLGEHLCGFRGGYSIPSAPHSPPSSWITAESTESRSSGILQGTNGRTCTPAS